jgi:nicotinamide-nucleotide amidase
MIKARLITIGTEITCGEVVNSNAAWVSRQLEEMGVRVYSHLSIRDQSDEIHQALHLSTDEQIVVVTGGLGPTSDDITRQCMAEFAKVALEFDDQVWSTLQATYGQRGLPLRAAHKHQCYFPKGSERLLNPTGTALGFALQVGERRYFVLPGPPRELEAMWTSEVSPRLRQLWSPPTQRWQRWTCIGVPESEVAELVEPVIAGHAIEVGYRATIPYVKIKVYVDPSLAEHQRLVAELEARLKPYLLGEGLDDLPQDILRLWPETVLKVADEVTEHQLIHRLFSAQLQASPQIVASVNRGDEAHLQLKRVGEHSEVHFHLGDQHQSETLKLPYRVTLDSDRGRRSATEYALWFFAKQLMARSRQASTSAK